MEELAVNVRLLLIVSVLTFLALLALLYGISDPSPLAMDTLP